jgi:hypothetical protein
MKASEYIGYYGVKGYLNFEDDQKAWETGDWTDFFKKNNIIDDIGCLPVPIKNRFEILDL